MSKYAVVTNSHRGVYYGVLPDDYKDGDKVIRMTKLRHVFRWVGSQGIGELVTKGPGAGSKIGPECPEVVITDVANVWFVTDPKVRKTWDDQGWD